MTEKNIQEKSNEWGDSIIFHSTVVMAINEAMQDSSNFLHRKISVPQHLVLIGGGLHAGVVLDLVEAVNIKNLEYVILGYYDDHPANSKINVPYLGAINDLTERFKTGASAMDMSFITCIGDNSAREKIVHNISEKINDDSLLRWGTLVHPFSSVSKSACISQGTVICAGAVIGPHAYIGSHTIINTHASVDHDCNVGDYVHVAPGVHMCGAVSVGNSTLIGVGSQIIPKIRIGQNSIIGAGTTVLENVGDNEKAVGIVKKTKLLPTSSTNQRLCWLAQKPINFARIEMLLAQSIQQNHFANFGPCVKELEIILRKLLEVDANKSIILTNNGSAALHAIVGALEIYRNSKLKFATQAFTFPTSVQGNLVGSAIVDIDDSIGLDLKLIDIDIVDGIIVTNPFGHVVDIKKYTEWADKYDKYLIFDNAATAFTYYQGKRKFIIS